MIKLKGDNPLNYCLDIKETKSFLNNHIDKELLDEKLNLICYQSTNWDTCLSIISYFVAMSIGSLSKKRGNHQEILNRLYELPNEMFLHIQGFDSDFIDYMMSNLNEFNSLEEMLIFMEMGLSDHNYDRIICS